MRNALALVIAVGAIAACHKKSTTTPDDEEHQEPVGKGEGNQFASNGVTIPPEKIDEINSLLNRKSGTIARCIGAAVDSKELPKNSRGKMNLEIVISMAGKATAVKVVKTDLESKSLEDCVTNHVREIQFPAIPREFETTFTYGFEAI